LLDGKSQSDLGAGNKFTTSFSLTPSYEQARQARQNLESQIDELRLRLDFMVFEKERIEIQESLTELLHQHINANPFSSSSWRDLVFLHSSASVLESEYKATFEITKRLSKWNEEERALLLNRCVNDYQRLNQISPKLCADLLANIPMLNHVRRLSNVMGVEYERLLTFFNRLGIKLPNDKEQDGSVRK